MVKANTLMSWITFCMATIVFTFMGCIEDGPCTDEPGSGTFADNSVFIETALQEQEVTIEDPEYPLSFTVKLSKASDGKTAFTLAADEKWIEEYNAANGTEYVLLPERNRTMPIKLVFPAGSTSTDVNIKITLPDDASSVDYVLPLYLADAYGASIDEDRERMIYRFRRGNFVGFRPAIDHEPVAVYKVGDEPVEVPVEVSLSYAVDHDITVKIVPDSKTITDYNEKNSTSYQQLEASHYTGELSIAISSGETLGSTTMTVNSIPDDGTYALAFRIESCSDSAIKADKDGVNAWIYPLRKGAIQAIQKAAIFTGLSSDTDTGPVNSLNLTLERWSMEYWFRFDDTSDSSAGEDTWTTSDGSAWRNKVFPSTCAPSTIAGLKFCIWPQDGNMGPIFDFTQDDMWLSLPSSVGGFVMKPDTWHHLAVTYDGDSLRYYLDGEQGDYATGVNATPTDKGKTVPTSSLNQPTSWSTLTLALGCAYGSRPGWLNTSNIPYMKLELAQMRLWNRAVEQTEIQENMGLDLDVDDVEGLEGYWKMDEGSGNVLHDSSGKGRDFPAWERLQWSDEKYDFSGTGQNKN